MNLKNTLLPHQIKGVEKLKKLKVAALFMEQGTGKTITALELIRLRIESNKINSVIWLCPCSAKWNIKHEIIRHCPDEMLKIFTICGIETLSTSIRTLSYLIDLTIQHSCFLVVDESLLIKNPHAYRTEHIKTIAENCSYKIILNGTPFSKNQADLFSQFYILDWRILGYRSYWSFAANHIEYEETGKVRRVLNTDVLAKKIAPYTYQVKKNECITLPDKCYQTFYFSLNSIENEEYDRAVQKLFADINEFKPETIYRFFSALQAVISGKKLVYSQNFTHFQSVEMFDNPYDNPRIQKLLQILPNHEKVIIFCKYESEIRQLHNILQNSVRFDGTVKNKDRQKALLKFSNDAQYLIANKNCAGYSLNLQFCHTIINFSHDWDLGTRLQSEDRIHRIGQNENVQIFDICAYNTLDEQILKCLTKKENLLNDLKKEIALSSDLKATLKKYIYGSKYKHQIFDCSELEDD